MQRQNFLGGALHNADQDKSPTKSTIHLRHTLFHRLKATTKNCYSSYSSIDGFGKAANHPNNCITNLTNSIKIISSIQSLPDTVFLQELCLKKRKEKRKEISFEQDGMLKEIEDIEEGDGILVAPSYTIAAVISREHRTVANSSQNLIVLAAHGFLCRIRTTVRGGSRKAIRVQNPKDEPIVQS